MTVLLLTVSVSCTVSVFSVVSFVSVSSIASVFSVVSFVSVRSVASASWDELLLVSRVMLKLLMLGLLMQFYLFS